MYRYLATEAPGTVPPGIPPTRPRRDPSTYESEVFKNNFTLDRLRAEADGLTVRRLSGVGETDPWWPETSSWRSEDAMKVIVLEEVGVGRSADALTESWLAAELRGWPRETTVVSEGQWTSAWPLRLLAESDLDRLAFTHVGRPRTPSPSDDSAVVDGVRRWAGDARSLTAAFDASRAARSHDALPTFRSVGVEADLRERDFVSPDWASVAGFLASNPEVIQVLHELPTQVESAFGEPQRVSLDISLDPDEGRRQLVAGVVTGLDPVEALAGLQKLDRDWWLDVAPQMLGALCVTVEYT
jgi:hypothetical protein